MKKIILIIILLAFAISSYAQSGIQFPESDTTTVKKEYPYVLPFWGQEVTDRNIDLQLPFGLNVNYVYNQMSLELTHFSMNFYDGEDLDDIINPESGNFTETIATSNGVNIRADAWILPFINVYGIYARNSGSTQVSFQPQVVETDLGPNGNLMEIRTLEKPIEVDPVYFTANSFGLGVTAVYGWEDYFVNFDGNMTWSTSDLLVETVIFFVGSARVGRRISFSNGMKLALYFGAMYRDFVNKEYNTGSLGVPELDAAMTKAVDGFLALNQEQIDFWESMPDGAPGKDENLTNLNARNDKLEAGKDRIENSNAINYSIKKEIINNWSTQV
ncbi:MAG: hypothetical protein KAI45_03180, partial [Melioribacteraceae bacterium]|nr:hypothetical protein [Melioribacteraceae bacterium]